MKGTLHSMPTMIDYLSREPEPFPEWLRTGPRKFDRSEFFSIRTLYYPGSGDDGQPVRLCAHAHAAHAFVYVDYGVSQEDISKKVCHPDEGFRGYTVELWKSLRPADLWPGGWTPHVDASRATNFATADPYALFLVLKRKDDEGYDDTHGPERLAGLFVGGDGYAIFDALYCQSDGTPPPFLVVVQDHGFGGNWDRFGLGGELERIARKYNALPKQLLVGKNSRQWKGYHDVGAIPEPGGQHGHLRRLHTRETR